ncbi:uncharacterized protein METZ01_LOCUS295096, partial [marine metagenome]
PISAFFLWLSLPKYRDSVVKLSK